MQNPNLLRHQVKSPSTMIKQRISFVLVLIMLIVQATTAFSHCPSMAMQHHLGDSQSHTASLSIVHIPHSKHKAKQAIMTCHMLLSNCTLHACAHEDCDLATATSNHTVALAYHFAHFQSISLDSTTLSPEIRPPKLTLS